MESSDKTLRSLFPERLAKNYGKIRSTDSSGSGSFQESDLETIANLLNDSLPHSDKEIFAHGIVQVFYRKDPSGFYKFLLKNKLYYLVLWTEAKLISKHFRLFGIVHIKWDSKYRIYECQKFNPREEEAEEKSQL